jgi:hypothetical protein
MTKNKDDEKLNSFIVAFTFAVLEIKNHDDDKLCLSLWL